MSNQKDQKDTIDRRSFLTYTGKCAAVGLMGLTPVTTAFANNAAPLATIRIKNAQSNFEREALRPYRFKGSVITEAWQVAAQLESDGGVKKTGLGTQGVLWSDARVFAAHSEAAGQALMYAMSERALQSIKGSSFTDPLQLLDELLEEVYAYGKKITGLPDLRKTFALNALVSVDNAAWLMYAHENKFTSFDEMIPAAFKPALSYRHKKVASIPSFSVGTDVKQIKNAADLGHFIMKLKIGSAGTQEDMLAKDMAFLSAVHAAVGDYKTSYTKNGRIPYYLDPNGRYEQKDTLLRLLDHAKKIKAFDQIALIEEPFAETNEVFVGDMGVTIAADESAHTVEDANRRIQQGYKAIVLKGIAKTLSMTLKIAKLAHEKQVPCFCADLTVNPILVDWNKSVASRLHPLPNIDIGLLETNGHQYYKNWKQMMSYHPEAGAKWTQTNKGVYTTDESFYKQSGGIFKPSSHYDNLFNPVID